MNMKLMRQWGLIVLLNLTQTRAHGQLLSLAKPARELTINGIPFATRAYWMRRAIQALSDLETPCPFSAFGAAVVNHVDSNDFGELICIGANNIASGNPTLHGEVAAINNCTSLLSDQTGPYKMSGSEISKFWPKLSLYTTAEPCPMCTAAIQYGGFREIIYGTSGRTLVEYGWSQIRLSAKDVLQQSYDQPHSIRLLEHVLANETDPYFAWQFDPHAACPKGCQRINGFCNDSSWWKINAEL